MLTVYYGVSCAKCSRFIGVGNYEAEALGKNLRDLTPGKLPCPHCGDEWTYQRADVAHSLSSDGKDAIYPQR